MSVPDPEAQLIGSSREIQDIEEEIVCAVAGHSAERAFG